MGGRGGFGLYPDGGVLGGREEGPAALAEPAVKHRLGVSEQRR